MGGYADKLSYEERWHVIHYIRSLQAKDRELTYNGQENTLNDIEVPEALAMVEVEEAAEEMNEEHDHSEGHHNQDHH